VHFQSLSAADKTAGTVVAQTIRTALAQSQKLEKRSLALQPEKQSSFVHM
jgi:hypothetical protein